MHSCIQAAVVTSCRQGEIQPSIGYYEQQHGSKATAITSGSFAVLLKLLCALTSDPWRITIVGKFSMLVSKSWPVLLVMQASTAKLQIQGQTLYWKSMGRQARATANPRANYYQQQSGRGCPATGNERQAAGLAPKGP